jgi:hypothetical protein
MALAFCHVLWESFALHYVFPAVVAPLLAIIAVYALCSYLNNWFWLKALSLFGAINVITFLSYARMQGACELSLFGYVDDDPGDIGIVALTLPLLLLLSLVAILLLFPIRNKMKAPA